MFTQLATAAHFHAPFASQRAGEEGWSSPSGRARRVATSRVGGQFSGDREVTIPLSGDMSPIPPSLQSAEYALVARLAAGEERALGELYDRYSGMAYALACAIVTDPADAEEVVADAFSQVWRSAATFDGSRGSVVAWLSTIVRSRALDLIRSQKRRARVLDEAAAMSDETGSPGLSTGSESPDRAVEQAEAQVMVRRSLNELPPAQRKVLELAYFAGMSQSEIASHLSEPLGTIKTRMRAGMEKLRHALRPLMEVRS